MDKRNFNKTIKQLLLYYGFEKTGIYDYAKEAKDGVTKIVVRAPDQTYGFAIGVQFRDFLTEYSDYSGKFSKVCMAYDQSSSPLLPFASRINYSEEDITNAIGILMERIDPFIKGGKVSVRNSINDWVFGLLSEKKQNDIFAYFDMALIDPYSDNYIQKQIEEWYKQGGKSVMSIDEYKKHKIHYDKYTEYGCEIKIVNESVFISLKK